MLIALIVVFKFQSLKSIYANLQSFKSEYFHDYYDKNYTFGIDLSHYQSKIDWEKLKVSKHPIKFVFLRASMGVDRRDGQFLKNWQESKKVNLTRGAYHYYDPNENSRLQAENFINTVKLEKGDFPPVLDIEELSNFGNSNLHRGLKNYLQLIENHYHVKPIIYTGLKYFEENLKTEFSEYPLWIAAYSRSKNSLDNHNWLFHQFTDKVKVYGIQSYVDGNDFNGTLEDMKSILIK